jgi:two-component system LytT family response regulator
MARRPSYRVMMESTRLRTVIVDDEQLARTRLRTLLSEVREIELVGEAATGPQAADLITTIEPDLLFLDIQMPGCDGFEVLRALPPSICPLVIFVTAYDAHAIRAFDVAAVDYLLKPVMEDRFRAAVSRAVRRHRDGAEGVGGRLIELLDRLRATVTSGRIPVSSQGTVSFVRIADLDWAEVEGNGVRLHAGGQSHLLRETMSLLERRLSPHQFVRVHRSFLVNVDRIARIEPWFKGDYVLILRDGTRLTSGRTYRDRIKGLMR